MVVIVMSCIVAMIMMRTIRKDLAQYESLIVDPGALRTPVYEMSHLGPHAGLLNPSHCLAAFHVLRTLRSCSSALLTQDCSCTPCQSTCVCDRMVQHAKLRRCLSQRRGPWSRAGPQNEAEESGWKMVSGDVFRAPKDSLLLCVEVGSGVQIVSSAFITLVFAALGAPA